MTNNVDAVDLTVAGERVRRNPAATTIIRTSVCEGAFSLAAARIGRRLAGDVTGQSEEHGKKS